MWSSFWRSRNRLSIDQFRYLIEQLQKIQFVNEVNKDFVIEALRTISELVTYGDQHDPAFFEFFMEKQVMGEFVRILKASQTMSVALQLLQTLSIMIQNLKSEHAIYYIFSNEHINSLITYPFDFRNEELLSYYISFLRAISGKLDKNTISLLVKTDNDEVVSFPLYTEAIKFAFHEENMVRIAVCALTLNVYHVGDEHVNRYITGPAVGNYFSDFVTYFRKQCIKLDKWVSEASRDPGCTRATSNINSAVDEIEDNLYYFSDIISSGVPNLDRLITDNILQLLVFPLFLPSIKMDFTDETTIGTTTSLFLLCCILRIVKTKDLASGIGAALFCPPEVFVQKLDPRSNGDACDFQTFHENLKPKQESLYGEKGIECSKNTVQNISSAHIGSAEEFFLHHNCSARNLALREILLSYIIDGEEVQVLGSLSVLATLLQTKELDESMLDALGILPQRQQHKKLLLQALVGESSGEEQLFSSGINSLKDGISSELDMYLQKLKDEYGLSSSTMDPEISPQKHRYQVLDALVHLLFNRSNISAETLWHAGWLLRQLLPSGEQEFKNEHLKLLQDSYEKCSNNVLNEVKGCWCDLLIAIIIEEWKNCKKAIEASSLQKDLKSIIMPHQYISSDEDDSSSAAGGRMCETIKVFVLHHQLQILSHGGTLPEQPRVGTPRNVNMETRAKRSGLGVISPNPGTEINLVDAMPCRISFERGKERHFFFLATSTGMLGWVLLAEELPLKPQHGVVRVAAPLAGSNPKIDGKHPRWLHLRIRPSRLHSKGQPKLENLGMVKTRPMMDGRWTLAFRDEQSCKDAEAMVLEEMHLQSKEVETRLKPLLNFDSPTSQDAAIVSLDPSGTTSLPL
ncbi:protein TRANSPARENT TESTA 9 isoform X1 [Nymphaea colorata]|nr:protein TRANSPARENT TESTA 9 isoform X1 [Nymphaea colorata]